MTRRALKKSTPLKSEELFIHLLKSRKSHDHLATLHSSSVAQNTCILECIYTLFCTVIVISLLLHPKVGIPEKNDK